MKIHYAKEIELFAAKWNCKTEKSWNQTLSNIDNNKLGKIIKLKCKNRIRDKLKGQQQQ